jgi:glycosyltransferase involved in cell wall biosynthesis
MATDPRVSICVSAYNAGRFLERTLASLATQSFGDFEVVVVDDGSTDNTSEIAATFADRDPRFRVFRNDRNEGLVFTRNRALKESRGDLIAIADADDICEPNRIAVQIDFMDANPRIGMVGSDVTLIDEDDSHIGYHEQRHHLDDQIHFFLMFGPCVHNPTTMYRRELIHRVGDYSPGFDAGAEDYHLWGKLSAITGIANIPQRLVKYRKHSNSVTADRTGVDTNIFAISADLIGKYLGVDVSTQSAAALHRWLVRQGMTSDECRMGFTLAQSVWDAARQREHQDTLALLGESISVAAWTHARYLVYLDRNLSVDLARFASSVPHTSRMSGVAGYVGRLATPRPIRNLIKSLSGTR